MSSQKAFVRTWVLSVPVERPKIETMGETDMADEYKCRYHVIDFKVGDACVIPVLRLQTATKLQLIKKFICCRGQL